MKAILCSQYCGPDDLVLADVPDPVNHPYGRMFVTTGNGTFDAAPPYDNTMDFGDDELGVVARSLDESVQDVGRRLAEHEPRRGEQRGHGSVDGGAVPPVVDRGVQQLP